ncbi:MAG: glutamate formimidoyltransferase [Bacillota bacterium]|nr:glutamate formimidoyltransferase [Bacillota bacterium]
MNKVVECVPNFSEGRRKDVIDAITAPFRRAAGVLLLDVKPDPVHNRTVVTVAGAPDDTSKAVFESIAIAARLIDLQKHEGAHPRMGATDVVPFVPVQCISMSDCVSISRSLAKRVGEELGIPVILYEESATAPHRRNLSDIRAGQFEGWHEKIRESEWTPDFGPAKVHPTAGVTVIGARVPLIAYNVNLGTRDASIARKIARKIRERSGGLTNVRAIGLPLEERGFAQVSVNVTDYTKTPLYRVLESVRTEARRYGVSVAESEIVGLVPMRALTDSASFYMQLARFSRKQIIERRVGALAGGEEGAPGTGPGDRPGEGSGEGPGQEPDEPVGERSGEELGEPGFAGVTVGDFVDRLSSSEPAPGGGTASSLAVSFAASLVSMVCRLTLGKRKFQQHESEVSAALQAATAFSGEALRLATEDSDAFNKVMAAFALPRESSAEKEARQEAISDATLGAARVPMRVAQISAEILSIARALKGKTNPNASSDLAVAALLAAAGGRGAIENVRINATSLGGRGGEELLARAEEIEARLQT